MLRRCRPRARCAILRTARSRRAYRPSRENLFGAGWPDTSVSLRKRQVNSLLTERAFERLGLIVHRRVLDKAGGYGIQGHAPCSSEHLTRQLFRVSMGPPAVRDRLFCVARHGIGFGSRRGRRMNRGKS